MRGRIEGILQAVNFLVSSADLVRTVSKGTTRCSAVQRRLHNGVQCSAVGTTRQWRQIEQYEKKHSFKFFIQWADNFICDEVGGGRGKGGGAEKGEQGRERWIMVG
jgi:hypothetical protein